MAVGDELSASNLQSLNVICMGLSVPRTFTSPMFADRFSMRMWWKVMLPLIDCAVLSMSMTWPTASGCEMSEPWS